MRFWEKYGIYEIKAQVLLVAAASVTAVMGLPWVFINYLSVGMLILFGFMKWTMAPRVREDETQAGS